jgi:hypothetical protein
MDRKTLAESAMEKLKEPFMEIPMEEKLDLVWRHLSGELLQKQVLGALQEYYPTFTSTNHVYCFAVQVFRYSIKTGLVIRKKDE